MYFSSYFEGWKRRDTNHIEVLIVLSGTRAKHRIRYYTCHFLTPPVFNPNFRFSIFCHVIFPSFLFIIFTSKNNKTHKKRKKNKIKEHKQRREQNEECDLWENPLSQPRLQTRFFSQITISLALRYCGFFNHLMWMVFFFMLIFFLSVLLFLVHYVLKVLNDPLCSQNVSFGFFSIFR